MESRTLKSNFQDKHSKRHEVAETCRRQMSYHQAPSCNIKAVAYNYIQKQKYII